MSYADYGRKRRPSPTPGYVALAVGVLIELIWSVTEIGAHHHAWATQGLAFSLGEVTGRAIIVAGVIWAVVYFGFARRATAARAVPYALILFAAPLLLQGLSAVATRTRGVSSAQDLTAARELSAAVHAMTPGGAAIDTRPKATGAAGDVERVLKLYLSALQTDMADYRKDLQATGVLTSLKPETLAQKHSLTQGRAAVVKARAIVETYRARLAGRAAEFHAHLTASTLPESMKRQMAASFDLGQANAKPQNDRMWSLELKLLDEVDATLADLQHARGVWKAMKGMVRFNNPNDLSTYNAHIAELRNLADEERVIAAEAQARMFRDADALQRKAAGNAD